MKIRIIPLILSICLLTGCGRAAPEEQIDSSADFPKDLTTEICVCHSINADGSIVLWGDRMEGDLFSAYSVPNTLNLKTGSDVALVYSESERNKASYTDSKTSRTYHLKASHVSLKPIDEIAALEAVNGARRNKYLKQYEIKLSGSDDDQLENITASSAVIPAPVENPIMSIDCIIDTSMFVPEGNKIAASKKLYNDRTLITISDKKYELLPEFSYILAVQELEASESVYFGTVSETPKQNSILLYLNDSQQLCSALIIGVNTAPGNMFSLQITPEPLQKYISISE